MGGNKDNTQNIWKKICIVDCAFVTCDSKDSLLLEHCID